MIKWSKCYKVSLVFSESYPDCSTAPATVQFRPSGFRALQSSPCGRVQSVCQWMLTPEQWLVPLPRAAMRSAGRSSSLRLCARARPMTLYMVTSLIYWSYRMKGHSLLWYQHQIILCIEVVLVMKWCILWWIMIIRHKIWYIHTYIHMKINVLHKIGRASCRERV